MSKVRTTLHQPESLCQSALGPHIAPLKARLRAVIESGHHTAGDVETRVKLLNVAARPVADRAGRHHVGPGLGHCRCTGQGPCEGRGQCQPPAGPPPAGLRATHLTWHR